jgi:hypothetical protein
MAPVIVPIVQAKVLGVVAVSEILGLVPLQVDAVFGVVTAGVGLTVTVIVYGEPTQLPVTDVGVITYSTVPAVVELGFVRVWLMVPPDPALAPVMPPVMVPMVQANVLGALDVRVILGPAPLQAEAVARLVTAGVGLTVTVIVCTGPTQLPVTEVGVILYWTVPAVLLLGLVSAWLMVPPDPADAPVMPPVIVPMVHANVLGALEVRVIFGPAPLQVEAVAPFVTVGLGLTVTVIV